MYKSYEYYNAGENYFHRWGYKAQERLKAHLTPNENGFYSILADGGKYWTIGTSEGKYGEYARWKDTFFSVNSAGYVWAKVGTPKAEKFIEMINDLINQMVKACNPHEDEEEMDEEE